MTPDSEGDILADAALLAILRLLAHLDETSLTQSNVVAKIQRAAEDWQRAANGSENLEELGITSKVYAEHIDHQRTFLNATWNQVREALPRLFEEIDRRSPPARP